MTLTETKQKRHKELIISVDTHTKQMLDPTPFT